MTYQRVRGISLALLCVALLACAQQATALSYELCDSYGAEWVTDSPRLTGKYPFYSLLFFCNGKTLLVLPPMSCIMLIFVSTGSPAMYIHGC